MDTEMLCNRLEEVADRYERISESLSRPEIIANQAEYRRLAKEHADLSTLIEHFERFKALLTRIAEHEALIGEDDPEVAELAREELPALEAERDLLAKELQRLLLPKDPNDEKNVMLEIRAGTGGEEAALFAADLFRMYSRYAERRRWRVESMSAHETGIGGYKEIIVIVEGRGAYSRLKYESGVHRVQRVPLTETQGRIHTSAVTVAVLPEADEVEVKIDEKDLRIEVFRSSGPGGQSVNTTDSAVRITHLPTGLVVSCQDEKSQHKNKAKAMRVLKTRLLELEEAKQQAEISQTRKRQVGSGDRSERIRTYNFREGRVTDHRIGLTLYQLEEILEGNVDLLIDPLITHFQTEALKAEAAT